MASNSRTRVEEQRNSGFLLEEFYLHPRLDVTRDPIDDDDYVAFHHLLSDCNTSDRNKNNRSDMLL